MRTLLLRGSLAWLFARALAAVVLSLQASALSPGAQSQPDLGLVVVMWVIGFSAVLVYMDVRRRKEWLLLRNLGLSPVGAITISLSLAVCLEAAWLLV